MEKKRLKSKSNREIFALHESVLSTNFVSITKRNNLVN